MLKWTGILFVLLFMLFSSVHFFRSVTHTIAFDLAFSLPFVVSFDICIHSFCSNNVNKTIETMKKCIEQHFQSVHVYWMLRLFVVLLLLCTWVVVVLCAGCCPFACSIYGCIIVVEFALIFGKRNRFHYIFVRNIRFNRKLSCFYVIPFRFRVFPNRVFRRFTSGYSHLRSLLLPFSIFILNVLVFHMQCHNILK